MKKSRLTILTAAAVLAAVSLASCRKVSLGAVEDRLDKVERTVNSLADVNEQIGAINASIGDMKAAIAELKASSTASSAQAQAAIAALEARIAALEQLQESLATKDWAEATFATLDAQAQTAADLARVQAAVSAALAGMPEGKTVTDAISEAIAAASQSVKGWVSEQLAGYYTIGTIDGKLSAMKTEFEAKVAALDNKADGIEDSLTAEIEAAEASITALSAALESAKAAITTAYMDAINAARAALEQDIADLDGKITVNTDAINAANSKIGTLEGKVAALELEIDALKTRLTTVENDVAQLKGMVQSVVFVPRYQGGCAVVKSLPEVNSFTLDYEVLPRKTGKAIADSWSGDKSILKMNYRQVATRAGLPTLDIKNVAFDATDSLLNVTVSLVNAAEIFRSKDKSLAVSLEIYTDATMVSSPFTDIDLEETANCYIVERAGEYKFNAAVRGNGWNTDGTVADAIELTGASAKVLWESFGTSDTVTEKDLISAASLESDGYVKFTATDKKGNAVIAVEDGEGKILWSWHIWLAGEQPRGQVYNNGAGTMMDRNLGATSAEKGNPGALGLLYQWGRKDPFLGCSATSGTTVAKSYPDNIHSADAASSHLESNTTLDFSISNPTVFLMNSSTPYDWYCTDASNKNDNLWKSSDATGSPKTMYDPCPPGYRVPDGGDTGVWHKAFSSDYWSTGTNWDSTYKGMDFGRTDKTLGSGMIWYPAAGYRNYVDGTLNIVGSSGSYWSCTVDNTNAYDLGFLNGGYVGPSGGNRRAGGFSVRCLSESR